ncbi:MAG: beta strand repeat-containing protein, partial [Cyanobium sp.]
MYKMMQANFRPYGMVLGFWLTALFCIQTVRADVNWDGDGSQGNFSWSENWYNNTIPSLPSNFSAGNLVFNYRNNASQLNQYYDWGWANINDIIWETTWAAPTTFNGNGNGLNFNQRLENRSAQTVTIGTMNLSGGKNGATQIELNPANGDLTLNGNIYNDNNLRYKVYGANSKMLTVNTALSGNSSVALDIEQYSKVKFTAAQTMGSAAAYNVKQGELWLDTGGSLASGSTVNLGLADANVAKFYLAPSAGGMTHAGNITVANSGGIKVLGSLASSGTNTFSGNVTLNGTAQLENVSSGGTVNFSGSLSGASGINVGATNANGRVLLSGSNSYTGATLVQQGGTLVVTHANALGTTNGGTTVQSGATLEYNNVNAGTVEVVTISGTGTSVQGAIYANRATGITYLDSKVILAGNARIGGTSSTYLSTVDTAGNELNLHLNGTTGIGGFALSGSSKITGSGSVNLTRAASAGSSVDFGNAANDYTGGTTVGAGIDLGGSGASLVGNITNNGSISFYTGTNAFTGNISGAGSVNKSQSAGLLQLASSNSYTGSTLVSAGTLLVTHNQSLGSTSGATTVNSGSTLAFSNNVNVAENVTISGTGVTNSGAVRNIAGNNTLSGSLTLATNATIRSEAGLLTLSGAIAGSNTNAKTLTVDGGGNVNLSGSIASTITTLDKSGAGTTTLNGSVNSTSVNVSGGLLALGAANRLADTAAVNVSSGTLDTATFNDTVGSLTTTGGTVGGTGTLTAANYNLNGGTVNANLGAGTVTASSGTTSLNGSSAATTVTVNGGTLNTGGADKLANSAAVAVSSGTLGVGDRHSGGIGQLVRPAGVEGAAVDGDGGSGRRAVEAG